MGPEGAPRATARPEFPRLMNDDVSRRGCSLETLDSGADSEALCGAGWQTCGRLANRPALWAANPGSSRLSAYCLAKARWIEPLTAPQNRLIENKWFIGVVTGEPARFV